MKLLLPAAFVAMAIGGQASAWEGITEQCYNKVYEPPQYSVHQEKIRDESHEYVYRGEGRVDLVRHPAWYVERYRQTRSDRHVLQPIPCH